MISQYEYVKKTMAMSNFLEKQELSQKDKAFDQEWSS